MDERTSFRCRDFLISASPAGGCLGLLIGTKGLPIQLLATAHSMRVAVDGTNGQIMRRAIEQLRPLASRTIARRSLEVHVRGEHGKRVLVPECHLMEDEDGVGRVARLAPDSRTGRTASENGSTKSVFEHLSIT